jgi:RNA recognition motif-containing protein
MVNVVRQSEGIFASWHLGVCDRCRHAYWIRFAMGSCFTPMAHIQEKSIAMEAKLYVGNLPYNTVDADLQTLFSQAGTVKSAQVIKDRQSGRSKGFGFVEMSSQEEAQSAITMFHGKDYSGRPLTVNIARPREDRPGGGGGGGGGYRSSGSGGRRSSGGDRDRKNSY